MVDVVLIFLVAISAILSGIILFVSMEDEKFYISACLLPTFLVIIVWGIIYSVADKVEKEYKYYEIHNVETNQVSIIPNIHGASYIDITRATGKIADPSKQILKQVIYNRWLCGVYAADPDNNNYIKYEIVPKNIKRSQPPPSDPHTMAWLICMYNLMLIPILPMLFWYKKYKFRKDTGNCIICNKQIKSSNDIIKIKSANSYGLSSYHPECAIKYLAKNWSSRLVDPDSLK